MTDDRVIEIDQQLVAFGWHYNSAAEVFQATADDSLVEWQNTVAFVPDHSLNELDQYSDRKQQERLRNRSVR